MSEAAQVGVDQTLAVHGQTNSPTAVSERGARAGKETAKAAAVITMAVPDLRPCARIDAMSPTSVVDVDQQPQVALGALSYASHILGVCLKLAEPALDAPHACPDPPKLGADVSQGMAGVLRPLRWGEGPHGAKV